jgi:hypothetical protein
VLSIASKILSVAATTQFVLPVRTTSPIALWHLLSLDAPTVAALWTWFIARASNIRLPLAAPAAMALAVWILYAADRLLDAAHPSPVSELEARHHFHHRHRRTFLSGISLAAVALAALLPHLDLAAIRLYLLEGALLIAWFLIVHTTRSAHRLPKEIAVGLFFSAATFIPTVARAPALRPVLLPSAVLFAALCSLNCLFIYSWEHRPSGRQPHATTRLALAHLPTIAVCIALAGTALTLFTHPKPVPGACALAAALLLALHRNRTRLPRTHLRAAADLALLTPALLLPFLR